AQHFSLDELAACARVFTRNETPARGLPVPQLALELSFLECLAIKRSGGAPALGTPPSIQPGAPASQTRDSIHAVRPAMPAPMPAPMQSMQNAEVIERTPPAARMTPPPPPIQPPAHNPEIERLDLAAIANGAAPSPSAASSAPVEASAAPILEENDVGRDELVPLSEPANERPADDPFADDDVHAPYSSDVYADWLGQAQSQWPLVKQVCKQKSMSVAALLNSARPVLVEPGEVPVLVLQADYQFHLDKLRDPRSRTAIEWALEQVLSTPLRVRMMLGSSNGNGGNGSAGPNGNGGPRGGSGPSAPRSPDGTNGGSSPLPGGKEPGARSGNNGKNGGGSRALARDASPLAGDSALPPVAPDALPNGHNGHNSAIGRTANPGKNGNGSAGPGAVRDAAAAYLPANVTPIRPTAARPAPRLEDEVRADAVIQTLLKSGIELADVRPLEDDE
ncbi:MAG: hypothetical protein ACRDHP_00015, partial [Ktedonobacterales bacterium]